MLSASFLCILDSRWGGIGSKGAVNPDDEEETQILKNEKETLVVAMSLFF